MCTPHIQAETAHRFKLPAVLCVNVSGYDVAEWQQARRIGHTAVQCLIRRYIFTALVPDHVKVFILSLQRFAKGKSRYPSEDDIMQIQINKSHVHAELAERSALLDAQAI